MWRGLRLKGYRAYLDCLARNESKTILLFACDTDRDMGYAHEAAMKYRVPHQTGSVQEVVDYLVKKAEEIAHDAA